MGQDDIKNKPSNRARSLLDENGVIPALTDAPELTLGDIGSPPDEDDTAPQEQPADSGFDFSDDTGNLELGEALPTNSHKDDTDDTGGTNDKDDTGGTATRPANGEDAGPLPESRQSAPESQPARQTDSENNKQPDSTSDSAKSPPPRQKDVPASIRPAQTGAAPKAKKPLRIGDQLVEQGLISEDQLHVGLREKREQPDKRIGEILVELGFISEQVLSEVLAQSSGFEQFSLDEAVIDPESVKLIPKDVAMRYRVFPVSFENNTLRLAMADIYDVLAIDQLRRYLPDNTEVEPQVTAESEIQSAIDRYYGHELSIDGILKELEQGGHQDIAKVSMSGGRESYQHPVVRLTNAILFDAVKVKASDLHFEPEGNFLRLRYRIDGIMTQVRTLHREHWAAISHRLKIMSGMNIADKLNPQDGRMTLTVDNRSIDFRVSSLPTVHGENIVMRILDKSATMVELSDLGFSKANFDLITNMLKKPEGVVIVTGPTGSGKTTTLYAMMRFINSLEINIMTLEDPVEYELQMIRQAQVRENSAMNFANGIRALLRQDPDVILVGEVRDSDTASMALRAAMTGHQVYTTLHTNDAAGSIPRLIDLGMKPSLMAGNIIGVLGQRLARRLCPHCRVLEPATTEELETLGLDLENPPIVGHPKGCPQCRNTGYRGRVAVTEILPMNAVLDEMIVDDSPLSMIRSVASKYGYKLMAEDGREKVLEGIISVESLAHSVDLTPLTFQNMRNSEGAF